MRARLFAKTGEYAGKSFELAGEATIGRAASNSIVLADPLISSRHSRIFFDEAAGCYRLEDLQSRNHTFLAGVRVRGPERLDRLDVITFGGAFDFIFQVLDGEAAAAGRPPTLLDLEGAAAPPGLGTAAPAGTMYEVEGVGLPPGLGAEAPAGTLYDVEGVGAPPGLGAAAPAGTMMDLEGVSAPPDLGAAAVSPGTSFDLGAVPLLPPGLGESPPSPAPPEPPPVTAPKPSPAVFTLRVERQDGSVEVVELAPGDNWVGRAPTCAVSIDDPTLSRRHARLVVGDDGVRVVDPGSTNHTYVGEAEVPAGAEVAVALGVPLLFGSVKAVLALAEPLPGEAPERMP